MNDSARIPAGAAAQGEERPKSKPQSANAMSRIKLALLEQYSQKSEKHGSDPYNTDVGSKSKDQWRGNARRI